MTAHVPYEVLRALDADAARDDSHAADYLDRLAAREWFANVEEDPITAATRGVRRAFTTNGKV